MSDHPNCRCVLLPAGLMGLLVSAMHSHHWHWYEFCTNRWASGGLQLMGAAIGEHLFTLPDDLDSEYDL